MNGKCRLCDIVPGTCGKVVSVAHKNAISARLHDLGLVPGTVVECIMQSPFGDPTAYLIRGAVIALREEDAELVTVEVIADDSDKQKNL